MRRIQLIYLFIAILAIAYGCSSDEPSMDCSQQEILLQGQTVPTTVQSRTSQSLSTDYTMMVHSIFHSEDGSKHSYYFTQEQEFVANAMGVWAHNGSQLYYPPVGALDFLVFGMKNTAHRPTATYAPSVLSDANSTFSSLTLNFGDKLDGTDAVVYSDLLCNAPGGESAQLQNLHFRHALAKILFTACTDETATMGHFFINQVTVRNVYTSGTLDITPYVSVTVGDQLMGSTGDWTSLTNNTSISILPTNTTVGVTTTAAIIGNPIYLPKQSSSPVDIEVELTYSFKQASGTTFGPEKVILTLQNTNWLSGYQYTYNLTCNLTEIKGECNSIGTILDSNPEDINLDEIYDGSTSI